jgi:hypothetical protein
MIIREKKRASKRHSLPDVENDFSARTGNNWANAI